MDEQEIRNTFVMSGLETKLEAITSLLARSRVDCELICDALLKEELSQAYDIVLKVQTKVSNELVVRKKEINKACNNY